MKLTFFSVVIFLFIACKSKPDPYRAGIEYCDCMEKNNELTKELIFIKCDSLISNRYYLLKIYLQTRDTVMSDIYDTNMIHEVYTFINSFKSVVDSCAPPIWYRKM